MVFTHRKAGNWRKNLLELVLVRFNSEILNADYLKQRAFPRRMVPEMRCADSWLRTGSGYI
jgi:hypothetical protein